MTKKEKYKNFCNTEINLPIFYNDWWLDAICGENNWDVIIIEKENKIIACFAYYKTKFLFFKKIGMPPITQRLGLWIKNETFNKKEVSKLGFEKEIMNNVISSLPKFDIFKVRFDYSINNWIPFYWKDFKQTTLYSYVIGDLSDLDEVLKSFKSNIRNKINKAQSNLIIKSDLSLLILYNLIEMSFKRQKKKMPYSFQIMEKLDEVLSEKKQRKIFYAVDKNNQIHSAIYLMWDKQTVYLHLLGENPILRNSGAGILLVWEAIKYTKNVLGLNCFDFEGSMKESIEEVRRAFGAKQKPYFLISKVKSPILRIFYAILFIFKGRLDF